MIHRDRLQFSPINRLSGLKGIHTTIHKVDNPQGHTIQHREFYSILCNNLHERRIWKRMDICICRSAQAVKVVKNSPANAVRSKRHWFDPMVGRSPGGEHGHPLQYYCLENPMDRGVCRATVHSFGRSLTWLSMHTSPHVYAKLNDFIVCLKLTQHCKSTISWYKINFLKCWNHTKHVFSP